MKTIIFLSLAAATAVLALPGSEVFGTHLFSKFQVKACTNCHDFFEEKRGGLAFASHKGRTPASCSACHSASVNGFEHPEDWFARPGLYISGMDAKETCEAVKAALNAKFKSPALLARDLRKHLFEDPRVLWGIEGGMPKSGALPNKKSQKDLVKGGLQEWKDQVNAWLDGGMKCE